MEPVLGHRNPKVAEAARLHRARIRTETGRTLIEGPHLLEEAMATGVIPSVVFGRADDAASEKACEALGIDYHRVDERALARLAGTKAPRGPIGVIVIPSPRPVRERGILVSWGVGDPGNVGALIRTAAAFGWDFAYSADTADPWSPKVLRAGSGGQFRVSLVSVSSPSDLRSLGYTLVAAVPRGGRDVAELEAARYAVLVGEEGSGLPADVIAGCDAAVTIPMPGGVESLNASVSASIIVYALSS